MATMSLPVLEGHNRSELFKKVLIIAAWVLLDKIQYWYVHWSPHYGHRWKRAFQHSLMSAVPVKVILMGFNLLLGARGNILMREPLHLSSNSVIAPMDATLLLPVQSYWSPLLSFATLPVLSGLVWWSSRSKTCTSCRCTNTLITIFQCHFTHYSVFIGNYSLFIAYLWVQGRSEWILNPRSQ